MALTEQDRSRPRVGVAGRVGGWLKVLVIRYRVGRWAAAVGAGLTAVALIGGAIADAESARSEWGSSVEVVLSRRALEPGEVITDDAVELASVPLRVVPADAVGELPVGQRVTTNVGPGEIIVARRLTSRPGSAASIALPVGTRGVRLDRTDVVGDVGDLVDLHALVSGARLTEAVVVHADESSLTVAVAIPDVPAVVDAISQGGLVTVLVP